jgi:DnaD/phage-associated family protein
MPERGFATEIWDEKWFRQLTANQRYLYIYLSTNSHCNQAGVYEIGIDTISFETKVSEEDLSPLLKSLTFYIEWFEESDVIWVKDFIKRQSKSPKFLIAVAKCLSTLTIPNLNKRVLDYNLEKYSIYIPYKYPTDIVPILTRDLICSSSSSSSSSSTDKGNYPFSGTLFLDEINQTLSAMVSSVDRLATHEAIKQKIADIGESKGFKVISEFKVGHLGENGRLDLCWFDGNGMVAAFEIDRVNPKIKSLDKLNQLNCKNAYIILRKEGIFKAITLDEANNLPEGNTEKGLVETTGGNSEGSADLSHAEQTEDVTSIPVKADYSAATAAIFSTYEENIGQLTPIIADELKDMLTQYPVEWFKPAFTEACKSNARSLRYIKSVLGRWKIEGFQSGFKSGGDGYGINKGHTKTQAPNRLRDSIGKPLG